MQTANPPEAFTFLLRAIEWALVPSILLLILGYGFFVLPDEPNEDAAKRAARAARWAGLLLLALFVVSRKSHGDSLDLKIPTYDFSWILLAIGVSAGYLLSWLISKFRRPRVFGAFVLGLVAGSSVALYSYFFIKPARSSIIFLALGVALGALLDRAFSLISPGGQEVIEGGKK